VCVCVCVLSCCEVPIYASYLHDAVMLYASALQQVRRQHINVRNGTAIAANIKGRIYESQSWPILCPVYGREALSDAAVRPSVCPVRCVSQPVRLVPLGGIAEISDSCCVRRGLAAFARIVTVELLSARRGYRDGRGHLVSPPPGR